MPQPRQRIVFCDCLDCREQPTSTTTITSLSLANEAAARQEPPPKCLLICAAGCLLPAPGSGSSGDSGSTSLEASSLPHLHKAVRGGNLSLLALRDQAQQAGSSAAGSSGELAELEQLLGMHQPQEQGDQKQASGMAKLPTLADRFKGMQAAFASNNEHACQLAAEVGMTITSILTPASSDDGDDAAEVLSSFATKADTADGKRPQLQLPSPPEAARRMLEQLDLTSSHAGVDLMMVLVDATTAATASQRPAASDVEPSTSSTSAYGAAVQVLQWLDRTLRYLNNSTALRETVLLTVVITPGGACLKGPMPGAGWLQPEGTVLERGSDDDAASSGSAVSSVLRPQQSFHMAAGESTPVDLQRPMLCLRRLPGVVRRDGAARLSLAEWAATGGQQALLAERLLPEVAYKVGRAPKYGA